MIKDQDILYGWICPRCQTVHSPDSKQCYCPAGSISISSTNYSIDGDECLNCKNCSCTKNELEEEEDDE